MVKPFGSRFGQSIGHNFEHDGVVIVLIGFKTGHMGLDAQTGCHYKAPNIIGFIFLFGKDEIAQAQVGQITFFLFLIAQKMQGIQ